MPAITLSSATPNVTLSGSIDAFGPIGTYVLYNGFTLAVGAAVFGPGPTDFSVVNTGEIHSSGVYRADAGIVLAVPGTVGNSGTIDASSGVMILGTGAGGMVTNSNLITARAGDGIYLQGAGNVINGGAISAYYNAISAGAGNVVNTGTLLAFYDGIYVGAGSVLNIGTIEAGLGIFQRAGTGENAGYIEVSTSSLRHGPGPFPGVGVSTYGHFTNEKSGTIMGFDTLEGFGTLSTGMFGAGQAVLYNDGQITAAAGIGLALDASLYNSGTIKAVYFGVYAGAYYPGSYNSGYIANYKSGRISGKTGVEIKYSHATLYNAGSIKGGTGVRSSGDVLNSGRITGSRIGDNQYAGTIFNSGLIRGGATGAVTNLFGAIHNKRRGTFAGKIGVELQYGGDVFNAGQISGSKDGISVSSVRDPVRTYPTGSYIYNYGAITGGTYGILIDLASFGQAGIYNDGGTITGESGARIFEGVIYNAGLIAGTGNFAAELFGAGEILNSFSGTLTGASIGVILGAELATLINFGKITGKTGVELRDGATLINEGLIDGTKTGVVQQAHTGGQPHAPGYVLNRSHGTITGGIDSFFGRLDIYNKGLVRGGISNIGLVNNIGKVDGGVDILRGTLLNGGDISNAAGAGVTVRHSAQVYNGVSATSGTILGLTGVNLYTGGLLYNGGLVFGTIDAVSITAPRPEAGGHYGTISDIRNYGTLAGGSFGVLIQPGASYGRATINNIIATIMGATGVQMGGGELLNDGLIRGGDGDGAVLTARGTVFNFGEIYGAATGVVLEDGGWLPTDGTIIGAGGVAVSLAGGATLQADQGSSFAGGIKFGGGGNSLVIEPGAVFTSTLLGFATNDTIDLAGVSLSAITNLSFSAGVLTITGQDGGLDLTFASPSQFSPDTFAAFALGNGTGITLAASAVSPPSSAGWLGASFAPAATAALNLVTLQG
jgi:hypothetical protein